MPDLAEEREEQGRWKPRDRRVKAAWFDRLVRNEFAAPEEQRARLEKALGDFVRFAVAKTPYYAELFSQQGLGPDDVRRPEDLPRLPVLGRREVRENAVRLTARALPQGQKLMGGNYSSGTSGAPIFIGRTVRSRLIENLLMQRQLRWFRFDPAGTLVWIRVGENIFPSADGAPLPDGEIIRRPGWPGPGKMFATGPFIGFAVSNPMDRKAAWLEELRPDYVRATSSELERLAFAFQERPRLDCLRGLRATGEPMRPGMEARIEATLRVPVHMSLGSNELGWVATRCTEGGRYHVHTENCLVEIVGPDGRPCAPGEFGRVLVTALGNLAMPLIRYDMDDMAQALDDSPCPCGRTLPAFGPIVGRYSHFSALPAGTMALVNGLRDAVEALPPALSRPLRKYRIHQFRDIGFELRLVLAGPLPEGFEDHVRKAWEAALRSGATGREAVSPLRIVEVEDIALTATGKFFHFTSDFIAAAEDRERADPATPAQDDTDLGPARP